MNMHRRLPPSPVAVAHQRGHRLIGADGHNIMLCSGDNPSGLTVHDQGYSVMGGKGDTDASLEPRRIYACPDKGLFLRAGKPGQLRRHKVAKEAAHVNLHPFIHRLRVEDSCLPVIFLVGQYIITGLPLRHGIGESAAKADLRPLAAPYETIVACPQRHIDPAFFMGAFLIAVGLEHPFLIQPHLNRTVALHHEAGALGLRTV